MEADYFRKRSVTIAQLATTRANGMRGRSHMRKQASLHPNDAYATDRYLAACPGNRLRVRCGMGTGEKTHQFTPSALRLHLAPRGPNGALQIAKRLVNAFAHDCVRGTHAHARFSVLQKAVHVHRARLILL